MSTDCFTDACWICSLNFSKAIKEVHSTCVSPDDLFSRLRSSFFFFFLVETAVSIVDKSVLFLLLLKIKNSWTLMLALVPNFWHMKHYKIWCEIFSARLCLYHSMSSTSSRALRFQFDFSLVDLLANFAVVSV